LRKLTLIRWRLFFWKKKKKKKKKKEKRKKIRPFF
jgi:hypothetical protein